MSAAPEHPTLGIVTMSLSLLAEAIPALVALEEDGRLVDLHRQLLDLAQDVECGMATLDDPGW